jgi:FKBP-type peptidyl-prolyl cis-trans isomerase
VDDVLSGKHDTMQVYMAQGYMEKYYRKVQKQKIEETYADNKKAGEKFLEENAKKEGVITLPSGLQYDGSSHDPPENLTKKCNDRIGSEEIESRYRNHTE